MAGVTTRHLVRSEVAIARLRGHQEPIGTGDEGTIAGLRGPRASVGSEGAMARLE